MTTTLRGCALAAALAASGLAASAARAHHGITGSYDTSRPIVLAGTVTSAIFAPPHPVVSVEVKVVEPPKGDLGRPDEFTGPFQVRPEDVGEVREVEFSPVGAFYELRDRLAVGDRVTVLALRNCLPPYEIRSSWIELADGEVVSYEGGLHVRVDGCP